MNIDQDTPLNLLRAHLLLIPEDTSERTSIVIMEAANRLELLGAEVENLRKLLSIEAVDLANCLSKARQDSDFWQQKANEARKKIKRLEQAGDELATHALAGGVPQLFMEFVENWRKAKEAKP